MEDPFLNTSFGLAVFCGDRARGRNAVAEAEVNVAQLHELSLLRKILLRMRSWQNYIFFEGV